MSMHISKHMSVHMPMHKSFHISIPLFKHIATGSWSTGKTIAGAVPLAVERINANPALMPGRNVTYKVCVSV